MYKPEDPNSLEKYSSAVTLSDMEIFIFPEIMYSLVLANIMSPITWELKEDPWFANISKMNQNQKSQRVKQFIMNNFTFNLDLDTWGLTTKQKELGRFEGFVDLDLLKQSNALFGYEGDKYYFDLDIRRHFGLDSYQSDVIPYWKTETIEAMQAFRHREEYSSGAGECVSLATLYAAALHVIGEVPLEKIFLMATPLHSQNFIAVGDGVLTNNRRIVTKNMWFNGTELSAKARRALENEKVTMVVNNTGHIHTLYDSYSIDEEHYEKFQKSITNYLSAGITYLALTSFLRQTHRFQVCFQVKNMVFGSDHYIEAEKVFHYEHSSNSRMGNPSEKNLLEEIDIDDYYPAPLPGRIVLNELGDTLKSITQEMDYKSNRALVKEKLAGRCPHAGEMLDNLLEYIETVPRLPEMKGRNKIDSVPLKLPTHEGREAVIEYLESVRETNEAADLAFTAFRDLERSPWKPFMKASLERNPVSNTASSGMEIKEIHALLLSMEDESIYGGSRMAQPDEVWNFRRGNGMEKAVTLANILKYREQDITMLITRDGNNVQVEFGDAVYSFPYDGSLQPPSAEDLEH